MLTWIETIWGQISVWITSQPTFVEVACGIGLFYTVLKVIKLIYRLFAVFISPLLSRPVRFKKQKDLRPKPRSANSAPQDDDSPPFVFR